MTSEIYLCSIGKHFGWEKGNQMQRYLAKTAGSPYSKASGSAPMFKPVQDLD